LRLCKKGRKAPGYARDGFKVLQLLCRGRLHAYLSGSVGQAFIKKYEVQAFTGGSPGQGKFHRLAFKLHDLTYAPVIRKLRNKKSSNKSKNQESRTVGGARAAQLDRVVHEVPQVRKVPHQQMIAKGDRVVVDRERGMHTNDPLASVLVDTAEGGAREIQTTETHLEKLEQRERAKRLQAKPHAKQQHNHPLALQAKPHAKQQHNHPLALQAKQQHNHPLAQAFERPQVARRVGPASKRKARDVSTARSDHFVSANLDARATKRRHSPTQQQQQVQRQQHDSERPKGRLTSACTHLAVGGVVWLALGDGRCLVGPAVSNLCAAASAAARNAAIHAASAALVASNTANAALIAAS